MAISETYNADCLEAMRGMPDNAFDLAIVDPPYGIGFSHYQRGKRTKLQAHRYTQNGKKTWDQEIPEHNYFDELFRVSKNQIIWGGNYFDLPPTQGFIFWNKKQTVPNFAAGEFAWTSFQRPATCFEYRISGGCENGGVAPKKIHPTQKPVALYKWLLTNYAKSGNKILDTHLGSGSSRIAAYDLGFDFVGYELDSDYFTAQEERFARHCQQPKLFEAVKIEAKQEGLFV